MFKARSHSSKRTNFCATMLDEELKSIYMNIKKLNIFAVSHKMDICNLRVHHDALKKKFKFIEDSPNFYLSRNWTNSSLKDLSRLDSICPERVLLISGKSRISNETKFLKSQLIPNKSAICALSSHHLRIDDTFEGGYSYLGPKLKYIRIPRSEAIKYKEFHLLLNGLKAMQDKKAPLLSNRGNKHQVFFENKSSNYVDLGIGVSRFMPGLYKNILMG